MEESDLFFFVIGVSPHTYRHTVRCIEYYTLTMALEEDIKGVDEFRFWQRLLSRRDSCFNGP